MTRADWRARGRPFAWNVREISGAAGDLGTLLPLALGAITLGGLAPIPVLGGFALAYLATGLIYRLPVPVQPMKAIAAVALASQAGPAAVAVSGAMIGAILLLLGATGWIDRVERLVPRSVLTGLQLGLGAVLALASLELLATAPVVAVVTLTVLLALLALPHAPAALLALAAAALAGAFLDAPGIALAASGDGIAALPPWPTFAQVEQALSQLVLPQLAMTLTNAVLLTALLASDLFGEDARHVTPRRLCLSSGLANLALAPLGALPMCHGAGGLAAHHRFGARSGTAPLVIGAALMLLLLRPEGGGPAVLAAIPAAGLGALLLFASAELAFSRRLFAARPSCWPVIAAAAAVTVWRDPFWGLCAGIACEVVRTAIIRLLVRRAGVSD